MSDAWDVIERPPLPEIFDVREDALVGIYVETRTARVKDNFHPEGDGKRDVDVHTFIFGDTLDGKLVAVFGKPDLNAKIAQLAPGDLARITYLGQEDLPGGRKLSKFGVQAQRGKYPPFAVAEAVKHAERVTAVSEAGDQFNPSPGDEDIPF